jgi:mannose-6-phosphate isomerase-like protein (cupin superfamily)
VTKIWLIAAALAGAPAATDPNPVASATEIEAAVAAMDKDMNQGFMWRPLLRGGTAVAALEIWRKPGRPAVHPDEAEYATVVAGSGSLLTGGRMIDPEVTNPGLIQGSRIEGGITRALQPGDVFLVPAGVPHWFGIDTGKLVLLGIKVPKPAP